ncbi:conserved hypothetical protein [Neisseria meningitidis H44/76]|nr:conserved hypothetical protein [Neisseria meningitidis H44/76]
MKWRGGDCGDFSCLFQKSGARSLGETEKKAIISWLADREDVATLYATPLVDGFYGDDGWENYSETYKQAD